MSLPNGHVIVIDDDAIYDAAALAELLGVGKQAIYNRRYAGSSMPPAVVVRGRLMFPGPGIREWLTTDDPPPVTGRKLAESDVRRIRAALARGERQRDIAERFDVSLATVSHIHRRRSWRGVS